MRKRIICYLIILSALTACKEEQYKKYTKVDVDNSSLKGSNSYYCSLVMFNWLPENVIVLGQGDFTFEFIMNKDNPFLVDLVDFDDGIDVYGYYKIAFYCELDGIVHQLHPYMLRLPDVEGNNISYSYYLSSTDESIRLRELIGETRIQAKIKMFKQIIKDCKLYAINHSGERLDFPFTKETEFMIYRSRQGDY